MHRRRHGGFRYGVLLCALALLGGCRTPLAPAGLYQYFGASPPDDAWSAKIRGWQERERVSAPGSLDSLPPVDPAQVGDLRAKFESFRNNERRELARDVAKWIQDQARDHYISDGPVDHWATTEETFRRNGDDCDGLELLVYHFLRDLGFPESQVFRAIVVRRTDGQHHMVTLWFEESSDPWVIDPTGAMTTGMPRMSQLPDWVPLKVFSEARDWSVRDADFAAAATR
jgi:predicted transglutaminase-like cysteine proteinase